MQTTTEQFALIEHSLPKQRGKLSLSNLQVLNPILHVSEHDCQWPALPRRFGYTRMSRWAKASVPSRVFEEMRKAQIVRIRIQASFTGLKPHQGTPARHGCA